MSKLFIKEVKERAELNSK
ncbi:hypothetical protein AYI69_g10874, partial [Smittium culicis]